MNKIRVFEAFAGYGGASFGLKKAKIPFEVVGYSEIDKFAIKCYEQNHGNINNYGDIRKINPYDLPDYDLFTGGFPCQPFSIAGNRKGELDPRGTLFYDIIRINEVKKPKLMLLENVKGLVTKRFKPTFEKMLSELNRIGYDVFWKVLNSKDYGIPQNRERVWFVCFRKDLKTKNFEFPKTEPLKLRLKDVLENEVDKKYHLSEKAIKRVLERGNGKLDDLNGVAKTVTAKNNYKGGTHANIIQLNKPMQPSIIRKLTPKECFRLMGFLNDEINLEGLSDTQKYKLAGNGWDINLVSKIFTQMYKVVRTTK